MSDAINAAVTSPSLSATLSTEPQMSAQFISGANVGAQLTPGGIIMNDYRLTVSEIERGKRLEVRRGAEVQNMDIMDGVGITKVAIRRVE